MPTYFSRDEMIAVLLKEEKSFHTVRGIKSLRPLPNDVMLPVFRNAQYVSRESFASLAVPTASGMPDRPAIPNNAPSAAWAGATLPWKAPHTNLVSSRKLARKIADTRGN